MENDLTYLAEPKWEIVEPGIIRLSGTQVEIHLLKGAYHVHRKGDCYGIAVTLGMAKIGAIMEIKDLLEMGIDP